MTREEALESVGRGWRLLIEGLYAAKPATTKVVQVKEKFGGLRFYVERSTEDFNQLIDTAESVSFRICEMCGAPGNPVNTPGSSWRKTLCYDCYAKLAVERGTL